MCKAIITLNYSRHTPIFLEVKARFAAHTIRKNTQFSEENTFPTFEECPEVGTAMASYGNALPGEVNGDPKFYGIAMQGQTDHIH
ncbi:hypothetical protein CEXT_148811 [Caerostris extrusa]|uniref:Uncharacterized protein n=1 Tax=Caerostris extrusa TaxID=172846 RepID=A0AAV4RPZ0_CAEEX|nr:hypothetical protein CEXT_148811 [Caerostris extrusa]